MNKNYLKPVFTLMLCLCTLPLLRGQNPNPNPNLDFSYGNFTGWQCYISNSGYSNGNTCYDSLTWTLCPQAVNGRHTIMSDIYDVDPHTLNARAEDIEKVITPKTKALLLLHYGGIPCEMDEIMALCRKHDIKVIEDANAGVCSFYKGKAVGTFGDMGMWSFDAMKILVCGDGAMLHFNTPELRNKADRWLYFGLEAKSGYSNTVAQRSGGSSIYPVLVIVPL